MLVSILKCLVWVPEQPNTVTQMQMALMEHPHRLLLFGRVHPEIMDIQIQHRMPMFPHLNYCVIGMEVSLQDQMLLKQHVYLTVIITLLGEVVIAKKYA